MRFAHRNVWRFVTRHAGLGAFAAAVIAGAADGVNLAEEFPGFRWIEVPPYRIVTDESGAEIEKTLQVLTELRRQFVHHFQPLIRDELAPPDMAVVFFGAEEGFRDYARRVAPAFVERGGFYSAGDRHLTRLNQLGTSRYTRLQRQLSRRQSEPRLDRDPSAQRHLAAWRSAATQEARAMTERLVRHEGAHQLSGCWRRGGRRFSSGCR